MTEKEFVEELKKLNIKISKKQLNQLNLYYQLLIEKNKYVNLTRIIKREDVYLKHYYDSLTIIKAIDLKKINTLCDVGTGAGFPGMVLKIMFPNLDIILIDSLNKRIVFLDEVIEKLKLTGIKAIHIRSEDYHEQFDIVVSRAVTKLDNLIKLTEHLIKKDGYLIAMKANINDEIKDAKKILNKYRLNIKEIIEFKLIKENSTRNLIVIKK